MRSGTRLASAHGIVDELVHLPTWMSLSARPLLPVLVVQAATRAVVDRPPGRLRDAPRILGAHPLVALRLAGRPPRTRVRGAVARAAAGELALTRALLDPELFLVLAALARLGELRRLL